MLLESPETRRRIPDASDPDLAQLIPADGEAVLLRDQLRFSRRSIQVTMRKGSSSRPRTNTTFPVPLFTPPILTLWTAT